LRARRAWGVEAKSDTMKTLRAFENFYGDGFDEDDEE
jgi:hypothetical protein